MDSGDDIFADLLMGLQPKTAQPEPTRETLVSMAASRQKAKSDVENEVIEVRRSDSPVGENLAPPPPAVSKPEVEEVVRETVRELLFQSFGALTATLRTSLDGLSAKLAAVEGVQTEILTKLETVVTKQETDASTFAERFRHTDTVLKEASVGIQRMLEKQDLVDAHVLLNRHVRLEEQEQRRDVTSEKSETSVRPAREEEKTQEEAKPPEGVKKSSAAEVEPQPGSVPSYPPQEKVEVKQPVVSLFPAPTPQIQQPQLQSGQSYATVASVGTPPSAPMMQLTSSQAPPQPAPVLQPQAHPQPPPGQPQPVLQHQPAPVLQPQAQPQPPPARLQMAAPVELHPVLQPQPPPAAPLQLQPSPRPAPPPQSQLPQLSNQSFPQGPAVPPSVGQIHKPSPGSYDYGSAGMGGQNGYAVQPAPAEKTHPPPPSYPTQMPHFGAIPPPRPPQPFPPAGQYTGYPSLPSQAPPFHPAQPPPPPLAPQQAVYGGPPSRKTIERTNEPPRSGPHPVPLDQVIQDVVSMGFERTKVRSVVTGMLDRGEDLELNVVIDRLTSMR